MFVVNISGGYQSNRFETPVPMQMEAKNANNKCPMMMLVLCRCELKAQDFFSLTPGNKGEVLLCSTRWTKSVLPLRGHSQYYVTSFHIMVAYSWYLSQPKPPIPMPTPHCIGANMLGSMVGIGAVTSGELKKKPAVVWGGV